MDKINWSILEALQQNARMSFAEIGRQVGLSAPAVAERMEKLEEAGIIRGFTVNLNMEKLGYALSAIVSLKIYNGRQKDFIQFASTAPEVHECHKVTGHNCFLLKLYVKKAGDLDVLVSRIAEYGEPVTSVILSSPVEQKVVSHK